jgi:hypothetical protein
MERALQELRQRGEHLIDDGPVAHQRLVQQVFAPESRACARRQVVGAQHSVLSTQYSVLYSVLSTQHSVREWSVVASQ